MDCMDYAKSFIAGKAPWNSVRFWVESRTRVVDETTGASEDYYQCASCKSEDTFAEKELFYDDNYDFLPIFGPQFGLIFRRRACLNENYRSCVKAEELWDGQDCHIVERPDAQLLTTNAAVRKASARWLPLVARTEIRNEETHMRAIVECPVKTINIHEERDLYQVDTGPIAFPDLSRRWERTVDSLSLAFVAFNAPHFACFVIEEPTLVPEKHGGPCRVCHYSKRVTLPATNTLYALPT